MSLLSLTQHKGTVYWDDESALSIYLSIDSEHNCKPLGWFVIVVCILSSPLLLPLQQLV